MAGHLGDDKIDLVIVIDWAQLRTPIESGALLQALREAAYAKDAKLGGNWSAEKDIGRPLLAQMQRCKASLNCA